MDSNGKNAKQVTDNAVPDWSPEWSPDGKQIIHAEAVKAGRDDLHSAIFVMDADGKNRKEIYRDKSVIGSRIVFDPVYSPDGKDVAFMRVTYGDKATTADVYLMKSDGTGVHKMITDAAEPAWSPDGKELAFTSTRDSFGKTCYDQCQLSGEL